MLCKESRCQCPWSFPSQDVTIYSAGEFCHGDEIYLDTYTTSSMHARVLTQKSEEPTVSSASLLATPLLRYTPRLQLTL